MKNKNEILTAADRKRIIVKRLPDDSFTYAIDGVQNPPNESIGETLETQSGWRTPLEALAEGERIFISQNSFIKAFGW